MIHHKHIPGAGLAAIAVAVAAALHTVPAQAFEFDTGGSDVKMRWDNTVKYSTMYRLRDPSQQMLNAYMIPQPGPAGDGNRNFKKGVVSNRLDLLSEFDVTKGDVGARISGAAWYDDVYMHSNDNTTGITHNISTASNRFTQGTKDAVGNGGRLMDAFVFAKGELGDMPGRVTLGRHAVVYGETLMSGANGIAAAQGPVDIVKAASVPGAQVKEFILPTEQVSGSLQLTNKLSVGGYYQFKWHKSPFFAAGSFLSPNDILGDGAEAFVGTPVGGAVARAPNQNARNSGQGGLQLRYKSDALDTEFGLYAAKYHDKTPSAAYLDPTLNSGSGNYRLVFQEDIRTYGASASTVIGSDNVSIEASVRHNMPLTGGVGIVQVIPLGWNAFDNKDNPAYAVGKTAHVTIADIHLFQPNALLKDGGSLAVQYDWHTVTGIDKNRGSIDPTTSKSASRLTVAFTADYFQVADGLDLSIPIVYSRDFQRSRVFVGWVENGGSIDVGVNFNYLNTWKGGLNYHHWIGKHGASIGAGSFDQTMWDRDYVSFNVSRSF